MTSKDVKERSKAALHTPTDLSSNATKDISGALTTMLADAFALYVKTKNFHWHVSGPHFRAYHAMFDEQAAQILEAIFVEQPNHPGVAHYLIHSNDVPALAQQNGAPAPTPFRSLLSRG